MSILIDITSGNISANIVYQVIGGTSIVYNTVTYNAGDYFEGVTGVTTYTKTAGTELVTEATVVNQVAVSVVPPPFLGLFNDIANINQVAAGTASDVLYYFEDYTEAEFPQGEENDGGFVRIDLRNDTDCDNIRYSQGWQDVLYLNTALEKPEYPVTLEGEEDGDGNVNYQFSRLDKRIRFNVACFEYYLDVLTLLPLLSDVNITINGNTYAMQDIEVDDPEWQDNSLIALLKLSYSERIVIKRYNNNNLI